MQLRNSTDKNESSPTVYPRPPGRFSDSPNARSKTITTTEELDTYGILNRHSTQNSAYQVGISEDKGTRRTMEDAHSFVVDFAGVRGQGFFAVFDGHAGKHAAEWCGGHFHEFLLDCLRSSPTTAVPDIFNQTFHNVDERLSRMCEESDGKIHSGCTAVTAFLRVEDAEGQQTFLDPVSDSSPVTEFPYPPEGNDAASEHDSSSESLAGSGEDQPGKPNKSKKDVSKKNKKYGSASRIKRALKSLSGGSVSGVIITPGTPRSASPAHSNHSAKGATVVVPPAASRRVLYSANAGDARGVLCRAGKAVRLTYDHKGSDKQEAKRITDAGGFVMSGRVNGVLAVTRSLGDSSMKEFVVGAPYTTETELCDEDEFLILACDGLWDVMGDQGAIDLVRDVDDAQHASQRLLKHALSQHTTDNVTVLVVRFKNMMPRTA